MELQVYHKAGYTRAEGNNGVKTAVISVLFDTDPAVAAQFKDWEIESIDHMFDSQKWDITDKNPMVKENFIGDFL